MTPKQQVSLLISAFARHSFNPKECAIIYVEGMIDITHDDPYPRKKTKRDKQYWQEVLKHLQQTL